MYGFLGKKNKNVKTEHKPTRLEGRYDLTEIIDGKVVFIAEHEYRFPETSRAYPAKEWLSKLCREDYEKTGNCAETRRLFAGSLKNELNYFIPASDVTYCTDEQKKAFFEEGEMDKAEAFFAEIERNVIKEFELKKSVEMQMNERLDAFAKGPTNV